MNKKTFLLVSLGSIIPFLSVSAQELAFPDKTSVRTPAVPPPSLDPVALKAACDEYYAALEEYSDAAYGAPQEGADFREISAYGQYLRGRVDDCEAKLWTAGIAGPVLGGEKPVLMERATPARSGISKRVGAELRQFFSFDDGQEGRFELLESAGDSAMGVIKKGFAEIVSASNGQPYLAQYAPFLKEKEVILTFDDGPAKNGQDSIDLAESLRANSDPSIFFVIGENLKAERKQIIKAESEKGVSVSIHGKNHNNLSKYGAKEIVSQLKEVRGTITEATGKTPGFFRPPYGVITAPSLRAVISELKVIPLGWTVDTLDWSTKDPEQLYSNTIAMLKKKTEKKKGSIILMHDTHPQSRTVAKRLLGWLKDNKYTVVSPDRITEAFNTPD